MDSAGRHSQRLRKIIALTSGGLTERIREFWMHPRLSELYPEFLFGLYGVVAASSPLLRFAADNFKGKQDDPTAHQLAQYLSEHAEEEAGHDAWLLNDLAVLGFGREQVLNRLPYTTVSNLVGTQYYLASQGHPIAVLGYLAVLENPAAPEFLEEVASRTGLPIESMSTLLKHARLDIEHVAEFDHMLDELLLTKAQQEIMTVSAISCVSQLQAFFEEVLHRFSRVENAQLSKTIFHRSGEASPTLSMQSLDSVMN